jgi:hypothetical protein
VSSGIKEDISSTNLSHLVLVWKHALLTMVKGMSHQHWTPHLPLQLVPLKVVLALRVLLVD